MGEAPLLLFDGVCNLCNRSVQFVLRNEREPDIRFATLQSDGARRRLTELMGETRALALADADRDPESMLLVEDGRVYERSDAALRVSRHLRWPYRGLAVFLVVPRPLRDLVYCWVARNRYRWFGKSDQCSVPTPDVAARFLS